MMKKSFLLLLCSKFLDEFLHFFNGFELSASNYTFYDTHIEFLKKIIFLLISALFANFKAKLNEKASKKTKNVFYKYDLESHFTSISGLGGSSLSKSCTIMRMKIF
jgi:hypothetical protein